ncbi:nacht and tpr domain protein [Diplodia corticola]|uniref:Nacht and tpr domain protein n=1 Tax=Diplodia corticola TaxID=236234 RepID=A0A1J9R3H7_9PEZI|nr:nacht and tpr domain protein [Diplodia corticola]OJD35168.1 nacht and tpr domain protein [Diplodia corticola]
MPPKRRGMRRFFCCGPKDEAETELPVKPAKQVAEKVDRAGVVSGGKATKDTRAAKDQQKGDGEAAEASAEASEKGASIPTSEHEATEDHLAAEKPDASTTEPEGIKEEDQQAETPAPTAAADDVAKDQAHPARADAPAGKEDLVAAGPAVEATESAAEKELAADGLPPAEAPAASSVEKTPEAPVEQPVAVVEDQGSAIVAEATAAPAVQEAPAPPAAVADEDIESLAEAFFTPAEEKPEENPLSVEIPAVPEKSESRTKSPVSEDESAEPAEPVDDAAPVSAASEPVEDHSPAEEPVAVAEKEAVEETPDVPASVTEEVSPAEIPVAPLDETPSTQDDAITIKEQEYEQEQEQEHSAFSTSGITATEAEAEDEDNTAAEESIVESREVVPVDPPVVLTKDEDTHSETHSGTVTDDDADADADDEDDASSHTTDSPEPGITREDSVIPNGSDQKVSMPRLFPHNKQGNILQRVIESYIINGRSDWKIVQKYLPKPTADGDDSAAKLSRVIMTRMLEHCLSEAELTEGRVFMPILREQLAHFYWEDHKDKEAIKLWRKVLGDTANGDSDKFVYRARTNATRSLCNIYFTKALEAHIAGEDPSKHAKKLEEAAGRGADPVTTMWWYAHCSSLMLTAWHQMHDEDSYRALENFRFNAKCAIGKLESKASSNAESGFLLLAETLMTAADNWEGHVEGDESATRAMSLFLQHHYAVGLEKDGDGDGSAANKAQTYGACETCDNELSWGHFQTCRYCKVDLCDSCHKSLEDTTLKVRVCSPIHDFFRTSGPAPHELPKDHVLLEGEQVHYKTWISMLKDDWAI